MHSPLRFKSRLTVLRSSIPLIGPSLPAQVGRRSTILECWQCLADLVHMSNCRWVQYSGMAIPDLHGDCEGRNGDWVSSTGNAQPGPVALLGLMEGSPRVQTLWPYYQEPRLHKVQRQHHIMTETLAI